MRDSELLLDPTSDFDYVIYALQQQLAWDFVEPAENDMNCYESMYLSNWTLPNTH